MEEKRLQITLTEITLSEDGKVLGAKPVATVYVPREDEFSLMEMVAEFERKGHE